MIGILLVAYISSCTELLSEFKFFWMLFNVVLEFSKFLYHLIGIVGQR